MKQWYLYYTTEASKLRRPIAEIVLMTGIEVKSAKLQRPVAELKKEKIQRPVGELVKQSVSEIVEDASNEFPRNYARKHIKLHFTTYHIHNQYVRTMYFFYKATSNTPREGVLFRQKACK